MATQKNPIADIHVRWPGTSGTNYVMAGYSSDTYPNTTYFNFEGSWPPDFKSSRNWAADLWE